MRRRFVTALIASVTLSAAAPAMAEEPKPFADFTFKRVGVPAAGARRRITVQIAPAPLPPPDEVAPAAPKSPEISGFEWYWERVSPGLDGGAARLETALNTLKKAPSGNDLGTPRLQSLRDIAALYGPDILTATIGTDVSPALVLAVISVESAGRDDAVSNKGATGLMQLMPATAARFGVGDSSVAKQNIRGGVAYLNWLMQTFDRDPVLVLAGYNAGENAVRGHNGVPPFAETRAYIPKVLAAWTIARGLCLTPPELVTDGCVFVGKEIASNG